MSHEAAEHYRRLAAKCVEIAHNLHDSEGKAALLNMAQHWLVLADQATRSAASGGLYALAADVIQQQQQPQSTQE